MVRSHEGQRHIQSALDLDLIDCGESISCKSVRMMCTVVSASVLMPVVACSCLLD